MSGNISIRDHKSLRRKLDELKLTFSNQEIEIKSSSIFFLKSLPKKLFFGKNQSGLGANQTMVKNPTGKILAKMINNTLLRKQGFVAKFIAGLLAKKVGQIAENKYCKS